MDAYSNGKPIKYYVESSTSSFTTVRHDPNLYTDTQVMNTPHNPFATTIKTEELVNFDEWKKSNDAN